LACNSQRVAAQNVGKQRRTPLELELKKIVK
jgi:hypothetical protein